eukprot:5787747-Pyramimonas_sp.AAC.1
MPQCTPRPCSTSCTDSGSPLIAPLAGGEPSKTSEFDRSVVAGTPVPLRRQVPAALLALR